MLRIDKFKILILDGAGSNQVILNQKKAII